MHFLQQEAAAMAERDQGDASAGTDAVNDRQQAAGAAQQPAANQGDGMEKGPTDGGATGAAAGGAQAGDQGGEGGASGGSAGGARESGRDTSDQTEREGRGGYGNDTGFTGGTVGSRDDASPYREEDERGSGGMR
jgi:hypothetical protein